jgi:hypothetical protein
MLLIILSWIYMTGILFLNGSLFIDLIRKVFNLQTNETVHFTISCIAGMAFTTFLVTALCIFIPINIIANIIIFAIAVFYFAFRRKKILQQFQTFRTQIKATPLLIKILFFCYLFTISFISSIPSSHHDDGLYYSTSIKWLQEYGTVPGLANLNPRIGFNSSWLILQSLFGFQFLSGKLFNDLNGLLYIIVFVYALQGIVKVIRNDRTFFTFLQAFFFFPAIALHFTASHDFILYNINLFSSPSPDVPASFIMWIVFLLFLENNNTPSSPRLKQIIILALICFLLTIKLSVIPIVLLTLPLIGGFIKQKKYKDLGTTAIIGVFAIVPWLVRNVILSGYIVFPFARLDLFSFDWKVPIRHVQWHENAIRIWAINPQYPLEKELEISFSVWFPDWFERLTYIQSVVIVIIVVSAIVWGIIFFYRLFTKGFSFLRTNNQSIVFIITCLAGILFWFYKGPDLRLGFGFCLFFCMYGISAFIKYFTDDYPKQIAIILIALMYLVFWTSYFNIWTSAPLKKIMTPLSAYPMPGKVDSVSLSPTITLYLSGNETCKNCPLPCTWELEYGVFRTTLRGKTLKEGFRSQ